MSILDPDSVLIVGAGTSAPFEIPLGGALIDKIRSRIVSEIGPDDNRGPLVRIQSIEYELHEALRDARKFASFALLACLLNEASPNRNQYDREKLKTVALRLQTLAALLKNQTSETIDDFIIQNPSFARECQVAVAVELFLGSHLLERSSWQFVPGNFDDRVLSRQHLPANANRRAVSTAEAFERNWVHLLINILREGVRTGKVSEENKLKIITFNYDCILEYILEKQFENTELKLGKFEKFVQIAHVHGACGIPVPTNQPIDVCLEWASRIHVVNQSNVPNDIMAARDDAKKWISDSHKIYATGFAFAAPNVRLLGLDDPKNTKARTIHYSNYDGSIGFEKRVESRVFPMETVDLTNGILVDFESAKGTPDRPMSVGEWFKAEYPGELPG